MQICVLTGCISNCAAFQCALLTKADSVVYIANHSSAQGCQFVTGMWKLQLTYDAIQRGSELMRHHGQELLFDPHALLQILNQLQPTL